MDEELRRRLSDEDARERLKAVEELLRLEDPGLIDLLIELLSDPAVAVHRAARAALAGLAGLDLGPQPGEWRDWWQTRAGAVCLQCGRRLFADKLYYLARLQLTSEPRDIFLTEKDLEAHSAEDLQRAADELAGLDPEEAQDEVFVRLRGFLCLACKRALVRQARSGGAVDED